MGRTRGRETFHPRRGATAGLFNNREVRGCLPILSLGWCLWSYQIGNHECPPESTNEKSCEQPFGMRVSVRHPSTNPSLILIENPKLRDEENEGHSDEPDDLSDSRGEPSAARDHPCCQSNGKDRPEEPKTQIRFEGRMARWIRPAVCDTAQKDDRDER